MKKKKDDPTCIPVIIPNIMTGRGYQVFFQGLYYHSHQLKIDSRTYEYFDTIDQALAFVDGWLKAKGLREMK